MEPATQNEVICRLRSVEGHVRGVQNMVQEGRPCLDLVRQVQALQGSLRQINLLLLTRHLDGCLHDAWANADDAGYQQVRDELFVLFAQKI
jgi:CsoR family transcriptional regulator, copper-sensing transcriptional repressor